MPIVKYRPPGELDPSKRGFAVTAGVTPVVVEVAVVVQKRPVVVDVSVVVAGSTMVLDTTTATAGVEAEAGSVAVAVLLTA